MGFGEGFFGAGFFFVGGVASGLGAGFLVGGFDGAGLTLADLASLWRADLRRAAVFFLMRPFLTALSSSDWALDRVAAAGDFWKSLRDCLMSFLIFWLFLVRLLA